MNTPAKLTKILIIRFSSIGDIVLTSPVVRCLKKQSPGAEIHYLTKKQYSGIISANPYIDKIHTLDERGFRLLIPMLKAENFDFIADLHKNIRSRYTRVRLRKPSGTFSKLNFRKFILTRFRINRLPDIHIVNRYFKAVSRLNVEYDGQGLDHFIPFDERFPANADFPFDGSVYVAIAIGARHETKKLPVEKVVELCKILPWPVVLLGGEEDRQPGEEIASQTGEKVFNGCGKFSVDQSGHIIKNSVATVSNDTGMMHIAAALRKKVVSVWGNTVPAFGMYPLFPEGEEEKSVIIEVEGLKCRPCSKLGYSKCPRGHFRCMQEIDIERIVNEIP